MTACWKPVCSCNVRTWAGKPASRVGDRATSEPAGPSRMHREVGSHRRHLSMFSELQRRFADLCSIRQQLHLQAQEDLGKNTKTGLSH